MRGAGPVFGWRMKCSLAAMLIMRESECVHVCDVSMHALAASPAAVMMGIVCALLCPAPVPRRYRMDHKQPLRRLITIQAGVFFILHYTIKLFTPNFSWRGKVFHANAEIFLSFKKHKMSQRDC
jgi:hypothetical protein